MTDDEKSEATLQREGAEQIARENEAKTGIKITFHSAWWRLQRDLGELRAEYAEGQVFSGCKPIGFVDAGLVEAVELMESLARGKPDWPALHELVDRINAQSDSAGTAR